MAAKHVCLMDKNNITLPVVQDLGICRRECASGYSQTAIKPKITLEAKSFPLKIMAL